MLIRSSILISVILQYAGTSVAYVAHSTKWFSSIRSPPQIVTKKENGRYLKNVKKLHASSENDEFLNPQNRPNNSAADFEDNFSSFSIIDPKFNCENDTPTINTIAQIPTDAKYLEMLENNVNNTTSLSRSLSNNRYFGIVEKLAPNEMIQKFSKTAPKNVQEAVKSTIMNIMGSLPSYALDAALITTNSKLANLMFQMQMTGYMFKNAEYRMSLTRSLKGFPRLPPAASILSGNSTIKPSQVNAEELTMALRDEVEQLRAELSSLRQERESELKANILTYIQALPEKDLSKLTSDMSPEVMDSIRLLVNALMERIGVDSTGPEVMIQQSVGALAQLCMWQMVVGYKLRELEALDYGLSLD